MQKDAVTIRKRFDGAIASLTKVSLTTWLLWLSPVLIVITIWVPRCQADRVVTTKNSLQDRSAWFEIENKARTTVVQTVGGFFLFMTALAALRNAKATEENRQIGEDKQISERFTKAVEMLANAEKEDSDSQDLRLGAIYALERIATDSKKDHWTIAELLAAYIRRRSLKKAAHEQNKNIQGDIQAALDVIGFQQAPAGRWLDLADKYLKGGQLTKANLVSANLMSTNLMYADLRGARLENAVLMFANLSGADLTDADLSGARLAHANLTGANLTSANLTDAKLVSADLTDANLRNAKLRGAKLTNADLTGTDFRSLSSKSLNQSHDGNNKDADNLDNQVQDASNKDKAIYNLDVAERLGLDKTEQLRIAGEKEGTDLGHAEWW